MIKQIKGANERIRYQLVRVLIAVLVIITCTASTVAAAANLTTAFVFCDNEFIKVVSFSSQPEDILNKANVKIGEYDLVDLTNYTEGEDDGIIYVYRACEVTVVDGSKKYFVKTAGTVKDALELAGVKLSEGDTLNCSADQYVSDSMVIKVSRAFGVTITVDGKTKSYNVAVGTVGQALKNAGITLGENDEINVGVNKPVKEGMKIRIKRVSYKTRKETETLSYKTKIIKDSSMYKDQTKVVKQGKNGVKVVTYKDKYVDGELIKSEVVKTKVKKDAVEKVVKKGTKSRPVVKVNGKQVISEFALPSSVKLDENGRPTKYKKLITGSATAYCCGTTCSTGVKVRQGYVAVNPKQIPYGTKMYIVSSDGKFVYGYAIAADTGGFATNGSRTVVDLYMRSYDDCVKFGRRNVEIYILDD
ncbi:MAG: ubiquitin-like domain-containing protein [Acutalibacteraceae bacterium]